MDTPKFTLLPGYFAVLADDPKAEDTTESGFVTTVSDPNPYKGVVVQTGPCDYLDNGTVRTMFVEVGHKVQFRNYGVDEVKLDGKTYLVMHESNLVCFFTE